MLLALVGVFTHSDLPGYGEPMQQPHATTRLAILIAALYLGEVLALTYFAGGAALLLAEWAALLLLGAALLGLVFGTRAPRSAILGIAIALLTVSATATPGRPAAAETRTTETRTTAAKAPVTKAASTGAITEGHRNATIEGDPRMTALAAQLEPIAAARGIPAAIDALQQMAETERLAPQFTHLLAHQIGRTGMETFHKDSHRSAIDACDMRFQFGCIHGVIEAYFETGPSFAPEHINDVCGPTAQMSPQQFVLAQQCAHGLGHAIVDGNAHDIFRSAPMCDPLDNKRMASQCRIAVFMANNIQLSDQLRVASGNLKPDVHTAHPSFWKKDDLNYPCSVIDEQYKNDCYVMLPAGLIDFLRQDLDAVSAACNQAAEHYRSRCQQSYGREMSAFEGYDPQRTLARCAKVVGDHRDGCYFGAAQNLTSYKQRVENSMPFCKGAPLEFKSACYGAIGVTMTDFYPADAARVAACQQAEPDYVATCLEAVRTGKTSLR